MAKRRGGGPEDEHERGADEEVGPDPDDVVPETELDEELEPDDDRAGATTDGPSLHPAVFAPNWRTVLVVDALMGVAVAVAGIVLAVVWNVVAGGLLGSCGVAYVVAVVRRGRQWAELRRQAGL
jgi:hypothetical protein